MQRVVRTSAELTAFIRVSATTPEVSQNAGVARLRTFPFNAPIQVLRNALYRVCDSAIKRLGMRS